MFVSTYILTYDVTGVPLLRSRWAARAMKVFPDLNIATCHSYKINYKYQWQCQTCMKTIGRHSKSINTDRQRCGVCYGVLVLQERLKADGTPAKKRQPSKWLLFCQAHMKDMKQRHPDKTHAEIMEQLSKRYKALPAQGSDRLGSVSAELAALTLS